MCTSFISDNGLKLFTRIWNKGSLPIFGFTFLLATPHSLQDLNSPTRDWTRAKAVKAPSPNHWTAREFLSSLLPCSRKERVWHAHANGGKVSRAYDDVLQLTHQEKYAYQSNIPCVLHTHTHTHTGFNMKYFGDNSAIIHQCYSKQCSRKYASNTLGSRLSPSGTL